MFDYNNFQTTTAYDGTQSTIQFGEYALSVVRHSHSYGGNEGLYEIAVFEESDQIEMPGITEEGDTVNVYELDCIPETVVGVELPPLFVV